MVRSRVFFFITVARVVIFYIRFYTGVRRHGFKPINYVRSSYFLKVQAKMIIHTFTTLIVLRSERSCDFDRTVRSSPVWIRILLQVNDFHWHDLLLVSPVLRLPRVDFAVVIAFPAIGVFDIPTA